MSKARFWQTASASDNQRTYRKKKESSIIPPLGLLPTRGGIKSPSFRGGLALLMLPLAAPAKQGCNRVGWGDRMTDFASLVLFTVPFINNLPLWLRLPPALVVQAYSHSLNMFRLSIAYSANRIRGRRSSDIDVFGVGVGIGIGIEIGSPFSISIPIPIPTPMIPPFSDTVTRHQSERNSDNSYNVSHHRRGSRCPCVAAIRFFTGRTRRK